MRSYVSSLCGVIIATLSSAFACGLVASEPEPAGRSDAVREVDFVNDLTPVFTKFGCNAGACHGSAAGRGGFKLSLYGSDPVADYAAIVLQLEGRRINLQSPDQSLVVLKPTESIAHGGGYLMEEDDPGLDLLVNWIDQGATYSQYKRLEKLELTPSRQVFGEAGEQAEVRVRARYANGSARDVTEWTVFTPEDATSVTLQREESKQLLSVERPGRHIVVARYLDQVVPIELVLPLGSAQPDPVEVSDNFIDHEILNVLIELGLPTSPRAADPSLHRRLTLHLTGRLPSEFDGSLAVDQLNTEELIDELLASDEFVEYWTLELAKLLRLRPQQGDQQGAEAYHRWLAQQLQDSVPYDALAKSLILASGDTHEVGAANFYRTSNGPREQAEFFSELFMASRLRCANCHNHPLDRWTQDDYHGLAAIFAKIDRGQVISLRSKGEVIHPQTLEPAVPRIPGEADLPAEIVDGRAALADWLTDRQNPYFAKAIVNRLWKHLMGRGLVEPVDDFRSTNPATHPALLEALADDFVAHGYDLRHTLRRITTSQSYARSSQTLPGNQEDDRFYSHRLVRPLEPEVLADAISEVLGVPEQYGSEPMGTRAMALVNPQTPSTSLDILGRCGRDDSCETAEGNVGGLAQMLHLLNGPLLNARLNSPGSRLAEAMANGRTPMHIIQEFYKIALNREPTADEARFWQEQIDSLDTGEQSQSAAQQLLLEDFVWSLLTSNVFTSNR